jgi:predicted ATP-grasp superfamily ATP-dependent carboligase
MNAIVLDGELKSALATVRSLGRAGISVCACAERASAMALHSKYANKTFVYPSPYTNQKGFVESVKKASVTCGGKPLVYAFSDATYLTFFAHREELSKVATLVFPEEKSIGIAFDKASTYSLAHIYQVPTITTYDPERGDEIDRLAQKLSYPAVMKKRHSVTWHNGMGVYGTTVFVHSSKELKETISTIKKETGENPLVQEFVLGEEYGVEMMADQGVVRAVVVHHRIRSLSPTGGASVVKETLGESELVSTMRAHAEKLVSALSWHGPIMVEFKVDSDTREPLLMEINGRFWGSLPLAIAAGVDMPLLFHELAGGRLAQGEVITAREGVTTRHFLGDALNLIRVLIARDRMRPITYPTRMKALRDFFTTPLTTRGDIWSRDDIKPSMMEYVDIIRKKLNS